MPGKILIVEDEKNLAALLCDYLRQAEFETEWIDDGPSVIPWVREHAPTLIILDLMLPGKNGLDICKEVRSFSNVPVIMLTSRTDEIDRLLGLELGADDYICKPFSPREVVARVKAVLRRVAPQPIEESQSLHLDTNRYQATLFGKKLNLTAIEFQLLNILVSQPGFVFSRTQLMERIYNDQRTVCDRTIDGHIKKLRRKISEVDPNIELIHSIYSVGYKYEGP